MSGNHLSIEGIFSRYSHKTLSGEMVFEGYVPGNCSPLFLPLALCPSQHPRLQRLSLVGFYEPRFSIALNTYAGKNLPLALDAAQRALPQHVLSEVLTEQSVNGKIISW